MELSEKLKKVDKSCKYMKFKQAVLLSDNRARYYVENKKTEAYLGSIEWFSEWKEYCFVPDHAVFSHDCLEDIVKFIKCLEGK